MKRFLNRILYATWFWALVPTAVTTFFLYDTGLPYKVVTESTPVQPGDQIWYFDLDADGVTELIHAKPGEPLNNIPVMTNDGKYYDQWNLPDEFIDGLSDLYFGDFDKDHLAEIYAFTLNRDSVFLNVNEVFDSAGTHLERKFITTITLVEGQSNSIIRPFGFFDEDGDASDEFYFAITTGFGLSPRHCYSFNLKGLHLKRSPFTGINFNQPEFVDLDGDQRPEIITSTSSPGNYQTPVPFTDYSAWLMVMNDQFQFKFPPLEFAGFGSSVDVFPIQDKGQTNLMVVYNFRGAARSLRLPGIIMFSPHGELLFEKTFADLGLEKGTGCVVGKDGHQRIAISGNPLVVLDGELNISQKIRIPLTSGYYIHPWDIDQNGTEELLLYSKEEQKLIVCDNGFNTLAVTFIDIADSEWKPSFHVSPSKENRLCIESGDKYYLLTVHRDPYHIIGYLVYPAAYIGFFLLIWFSRKLNTYQVEKREALNQRLLNLQLQSIKGQLDPHFTFNALNAISSMLYLDDRKSAYDALNIFTRLLRQLLNDADRVFRTLQQEIDFVTRYMDLEKMRFGQCLSYSIEIGAGITGKELVPKMVLQIFAENAIKHGLRPRENDGKVLVKIQKTDDYLLLIIQDNGIGRAKAAMQNENTGKGLKINSEFYEIINQLTSRPIKQVIIDLVDDHGNPAGTRVEVMVPADLTAIR